ncbi:MULTISPECIES: hypothetical protein [unclassified Mucilaginibacter]|uniref:hypothetical protein n=1 Tax=unclassified Mucilaginibacter TaxID=2617802 RepID=UPI002B228D34|nr:MULTISPECIES: hypothetical protein [unclassified Mucilaginibacter]MEB0279692.1 hypothetical protein [Mucilaginibacter sp. 10B2]MEB0302530.1 hypothetical protein [Mucilaginibacter sp. 5C4]
MFLAKAPSFIAFIPPHKWDGNEFQFLFNPFIKFIAVWVQPTGHKNNKKMALAKIFPGLSLKAISLVDWVSGFRRRRSRV